MSVVYGEGGMMKLAFGTGATDWQERINFDKMRQDRLAKGQAMMKKHGIASALLTRPENIRYMLGLRGAPEFAPMLRYALVFAEQDSIMYELGDMLEQNRVHCPWIKPENWRYAFCWLGGCCGQEATAEVAKRWAAAIYEDLKAKGLHKERLGVDAIDEAARRALIDAGIEPVGAMPVLREARRTKTREELLCLKMGCAIGDVGYAKVCEILKPGLRECDVGGVVMDAMLKAGAEHANAGARSGPNTFEMYHIGNTDRIIQFGDLVYVNLCSTQYMGYKICVYRSFIAGRKPNAKERDWYKRLHDRLYAVIDAIQPGATTADAAKHFPPASTWGYEADERLLVSEVGHGIGFTYDEPIISRIWSFEHPQVFEPGMVIAVEGREGEPGYGGVRFEEMVVVTEKGHEIITTWPSEEIIPAGLFMG
jgi:Xaa-Pro aminopeptidase